MNPKISIVIPVYNVAQYLRECLDSVLAQIFTDWEAICVDDGSTDGSGAILDEYAEMDLRFRIIHQKNAGVSTARNVGIGLARGEYVTFMDADDVILSDWFRRASAIIQNEQPDLLRMKLKYWRTSGYEDISFPSPVVLEGRENVVNWGWRNLMSGGWSVLFFIRKATTALRSGYGFPTDVKVREDLIFVLGLLPSVNKFIQTDFAGYLYRTHMSSSYYVQPRSASDTASFIEGMNSVWQMTSMAGLHMDQLVSWASTSECVAAFLEFIARSRKEDRHEVGRLENAVRTARQLNVFKERYVSVRWRWAFQVYRFTGWLFVFFVNLSLLHRLSQTKKIMKSVCNMRTKYKTQRVCI